MQSISPGLVRTEFRGRLYKYEDLEASKKDYGNGVSVVHLESNIAMCLCHAEGSGS